MSILEKEKYSMLKFVLLKCSFVDLYTSLQNLKINPLTIRDPTDNTLIQICASNNLLEKLEFLLEYVHRFFTDADIPQWLNHKNSDSMTALHLAVLSGNFALVQLLIARGASIHALSAHGLTVMHLAAKSNNILLLVYFKNQGLSFVQTDSRGATPLHWAAYLGCELSAFTLISWSSAVNVQDYEGFTPLHLAATNGNKQIVRILLLKGANPEISDFHGRRPIDFAHDYGFLTVVRLLKEPQCLTLLGIRPPHRPVNKRWRLCLLFFGMLALATGFNMYVTRDYFFIGFSVLQWVLSAAIVGKDPGWIRSEKKDPGWTKTEKKDLFELCMENEAVMICPECVVQRKPRSIHCQICERCVEKFDHHCPWINNCVGGKNIGLFFVFLLVTEVFIAVCLYCEVVWFLWGSWEVEEVFDWVLVFVGGVLGAVEAGFFMPVGFLLIVQCRNLCVGKTTNERFSKNEVECEYADVDRSSVCRNVFGMCCNADNLALKGKETKKREEFDFDAIVLEYERTKIV